MIVAIVLGGGSSRRMGKGNDKMFMKLNGETPLIAHTLIKFQNCQAIKRIFLVARQDAINDFQKITRDFRISKVQHIIAGGPERRDSVWNGLRALPKTAEIVLIHDGARPCVPPQTLDDCIASAREFGSGIAACKVTDTIKEVDENGLIKATIPREHLWAAQTPQAFQLDLITRAYRNAIEKNVPITDDASAVELLGEPVRIVPSVTTNLKVTTPVDVDIAKVLLPANVVADTGMVPTGTFFFGKKIEERYR